MKQKSFYSMQMLDVKIVFTSFKKMHLEMKTSMNKKQKTAPSWSFILPFLMTTNKFSKFGRICIDQGLKLVFEKPCNSLWDALNSLVISTLGILNLGDMTTSGTQLNSLGSTPSISFSLLSKRLHLCCMSTCFDRPDEFFLYLSCS